MQVEKKIQQLASDFVMKQDLQNDNIKSEWKVWFECEIKMLTSHRTTIKNKIRSHQLNWQIEEDKYNGENSVAYQEAVLPIIKALREEKIRNIINENDIYLYRKIRGKIDEAESSSQQSVVSKAESEVKEKAVKSKIGQRCIDDFFCEDPLICDKKTGKCDNPPDNLKRQDTAFQKMPPPPPSSNAPKSSSSSSLTIKNPGATGANPKAPASNQLQFSPIATNNQQTNNQKMNVDDDDDNDSHLKQKKKKRRKKRGGGKTKKNKRRMRRTRNKRKRKKTKKNKRRKRKTRNKRN
jgi:hypothetical protein